jgi:hypothetical protein
LRAKGRDFCENRPVYYDVFVLRVMAMNPQRIAKGMSKGSKKGNASAAIITPTITKHPNTITPIPAKTNTKRVAAQKSAINATTSPPTPIASFSGQVTCCPLITMVTALLSRNSPHATITSIGIARAIASFFAIGIFAGYFQSLTYFLL